MLKNVKNGNTDKNKVLFYNSDYSQTDLDIMALIPQFGGLIWTLLAFVIALSVIVAIHEYGHYIVGRWSGIHADVFSLGFGPVIYSRYDKRGTKWQIAALPFGGIAAREASGTTGFSVNSENSATRVCEPMPPGGGTPGYSDARACANGSRSTRVGYHTPSALRPTVSLSTMREVGFPSLIRDISTGR